MTALFLIGCIAGGLVGARLGKVSIQERSKIENLNDNIMKQLTEQLSLRPEQVQEINPLIDQGCDELREVHREGASKVEQIIRRYHDKIAATQLDPDQLAKLKLLEDLRRNKSNHADREIKNPLD